MSLRQIVIDSEDILVIIVGSRRPVITIQTEIVGQRQIVKELQYRWIETGTRDDIAREWSVVERIAGYGTTREIAGALGLGQRRRQRARLGPGVHRNPR